MGACHHLKAGEAEGRFRVPRTKKLRGQVLLFRAWPLRTGHSLASVGNSGAVMISCSIEMGGWSLLLRTGPWAVTAEALLMGAGSQQKG